MAKSKTSGFLKKTRDRADLVIPSPTACKPAKTVRSGHGGVSATLEDGVIVLRLPLFAETTRKPSSTGKSTLCASTRGPRVVKHVTKTGEVAPVEIDGKPLKVIASAFITRKDSTTVTKE